MIRRIVQSGVLVMSVAAMTAGEGCAAGSSARGTPGAVPIDLTLDVSVRPSAGPDGEVDSAMLGILPGGGGRFVMGPDGLLRFGPTGRPHADWTPTASRLLSQDELAALWTLIRQLGYADPDRADQTTTRAVTQSDEGPMQPGHGRLALSGWNTRWHFERAIEARDDDAANVLAYDPAMRQLVTRLAQLAWLEPNRPAHTVVPRRYQFGPDPYAMYRR